MTYTLPALGYDYTALEPYIDAATMQIHHTKHHQTYIDKFNAVLAKYPDIANEKPEDLMRTLSSLPIDEKDKTMIRNHGGGHLNHSLFWSLMDPKNTKDTSLVARIEKSFGSVDAFKKQFSDTAAGQFGSGWAWLVENEKKELEVYSLPNQDSPYLKAHTPLIGLDVWEHAYYLTYQNKRPDYITAWWNIVKII